MLVSILSPATKDREPAKRAVPVQEAPHSELGKQLPAVPAVPLWGADGADAAGAEREPPGMPAGGAGRVQAAEEDGPGGGGGPVQHPVHRGQGAAVESRQRTGLKAALRRRVKPGLLSQKAPLQREGEPRRAEPPSPEQPEYQAVTLHTDLGEIKIELFCERTPKSCENFLALCASGFYNDCTFHRNIKGFMVQTGDPTGSGKGGTSIWGRKFEDEFSEHLKHNVRGVVSMANNGPNTNGSQFFITYAKQPHLDMKYTAFGKVIDGLETLDEIEKLPVNEKTFRPLTETRIKDVTIHANPTLALKYDVRARQTKVRRPRAGSAVDICTGVLFAKLGALLALNGRDEENLRKVARECVECGAAEPLLVPGDLTDEETVKKTVERTVAHFGRLDVLVNSAGILAMGGIESADLAQYDRVMNINVRSVFHLTQLCVPHLIKTKGSVVNVSSVNGQRSFPGVLAYCMSKSAIDQFTRCTALELASKQVRVNSVCPGVIITDVHKRAGLDEQQYKQFLERCQQTHALGRPGEVEEVAHSIAFLASDAASFITGVNLPIDGGRHAMCPR
ncbi:hypothetical protein fugu_003557 [Takifugu bimaculatus]|uniref:peptidylprolyl isomerase n=1 Tax=Takifugu bimaculatus TaxID=433685 RepID=A0A4Z2BAE7_9TELE|nr:hypothetical protein fugu_003557 [Takifugu bimaculatus]